MKPIYTVEDAYQVIAFAVLSCITAEPWTKTTVEAKIYKQMVSSELSIWCGEIEDFSKSIRKPHSTNFLNAVLFLRDDLLKTTGHRAWGLTYTLLPTGKMNIEYSYDKPEDYEEEDQ